jgi:hypothetical protein
VEQGSEGASSDTPPSPTTDKGLAAVRHAIHGTLLYGPPHLSLVCSRQRHTRHPFPPFESEREREKHKQVQCIAVLTVGYNKTIRQSV